jgi:hypothetical protein
MDSENIRQNRAGWIKLWNADRLGKQNTMSAKERKVLAQLPDKLPIYRGIGSAKGRNGLSWTLNRERAIFFAQRFVGVSRLGRSSLLIARAYKSDVHALLLGRNEEEVVIDKFQITWIEKVPASVVE